MNFLGITWHESMEESLDRNWQDNIKENILIHLIQFQVTYKSFFHPAILFISSILVLGKPLS